MFLSIVITFKNIKTIIIKSAGVKYFPTLFTSLFGFKHTNKATEKNTKVYKNLARFILNSSGMYGAIAISKGTDPALSMPSPGPIDKYIAVVKTTENKGETLFDKFVNPSVFPTTIAPITGNIIAVTQNANKEIKVKDPAWFPKSGGKIKFPAPKNKPNSITLTCKN
ncbi:hypothetical protein HMPREF3224_00454 [Anaerococcus hydrogenalis]|nr:hypothetical protein HMPREF3224_00454 [Anaerococcus hydrogenalis]